MHHSRDSQSTRNPESGIVSAPTGYSLFPVQKKHSADPNSTISTCQTQYPSHESYASHHDDGKSPKYESRLDSSSCSSRPQEHSTFDNKNLNHPSPSIIKDASSSSSTMNSQDVLPDLPKSRAKHYRTMTVDNTRPRLYPLQTRNRSNTSSMNEFISSVKQLPASRAELASPKRHFQHSRVPSTTATSSPPSFSGTTSLGRSFRLKASRLLRRLEDEHKSEIEDIHDINDPAPARLQRQGTSDTPSGDTSDPISTDTAPSIPQETKRTIPILKRNISEPFNFQHIMHANHSQVRNIDHLPAGEVMESLSSLKELEVPTADDSKARDTAMYGSAVPDTSDTSPSVRPVESRQSLRAEDHDNSLEERVSILLPSILGDPTSRMPADLPIRASDPPSSRRMSQSRSSVQSSVPLTPWVPPTGIYNSGTYEMALPHALTTADNVATNLSPLSRASIDRGSCSSSQRKPAQSAVVNSGTIPTRRSSVSATSPSSMTKSTPRLRHSKSTSNVRGSTLNAHSAASKHSYSRTSTAPAMPDVPTPTLPLGTVQSRSLADSSAFIPPSSDLWCDSIKRCMTSDLPGSQVSSPGSSFSLPDCQDSWENSIDWCYEHAAEAECDFSAVGASHVVADQSPVESFPGTIDIMSIHPALRGRVSSSSSTYSISPSLVHLQTSGPPSAISTQSSFDSISEVLSPAGSSCDPTDFTQTFTLPSDAGSIGPLRPCKKPVVSNKERDCHAHQSSDNLREYDNLSSHARMEPPVTLHHLPTPRRQSQETLLFRRGHRRANAAGFGPRHSSLSSMSTCGTYNPEAGRNNRRNESVTSIPEDS